MVQVRVVEYEPVLYFGSSVRENVTLVEFGSAVLHGAPPPVHVEAPTETTRLAVPVFTVCVPEQGVPRVALLHVNVNWSPALSGLEIEGPPEGVKSLLALTVMAPWPLPCVVLAR